MQMRCLNRRVAWATEQLGCFGALVFGRPQAPVPDCKPVLLCPLSSAAQHRQLRTLPRPRIPYPAQQDIEIEMDRFEQAKAGVLKKYSMVSRPEGKLEDQLGVAVDALCTLCIGGCDCAGVRGAGTGAGEVLEYWVYGNKVTKCGSSDVPAALLSALRVP